MTNIEWTDETWNPITGCSKVSPGCDGCYAIRDAGRLAGNPNPKIAAAYAGTVADGDWTGKLNLLPSRLDQPLRWTRPRRIFVNSMSDLFHPQVPFEFQCLVFTTMAKAHRHTFQVLTKRPQLMATFPDRWAVTRPSIFAGNTLRNVWLGTSIESNRYVWRADHLRDTPAAVRFLSLEPLLGPLPDLDLTNIDWVIVGGESKTRADLTPRPMHPDWVRDIRDRCVQAGVAFHFKQWGDWTHCDDRLPPVAPDAYVNRRGEMATEADALADGGQWQGMWQLGKKHTGRELDGRTWDEYPQAA